MIVSRFKLWVLALILSLSSFSLMASELADAEYPDKWNSAVIFSAGWAKEKNACGSPWMGDFDSSLGSYCSEGHQAYRLAFDHQFTPVWGIDVSYGDLGNAQGRGFFIGSGASELWAMKASGWAVDATYTFHPKDKISLLAKLGAVRAEFTESIHTSISGVAKHGITLNGINIINTNRIGLTYGIGVQYDFNDTYAFRAQYENFGKYDVYSIYGVSAPPKISLSMISAGLVLKF